MAASGSSFNPTPLAHADNLGEGHLRGSPLQWCPTKFNLYNPKVRDAVGLGGLQERRDQKPSDFIYDLLKLHKQLGLGMSEEALVDRIFVRIKPQVQDYVVVRNPQNTVQLLEVLSMFVERYSCKTMRGSRNNDSDERRDWNERRMSNADDSRKYWRNSEVLRRPSNGKNYYRGPYKNGRLVKEISGAEGILRGQGGDDESASFKIAGFTKVFRAAYGASSIGVYAVLNQEQRPVVFASCTLSSAERNYTLIEGQRKGLELGHIYRYLENPEDSSVNATILKLISDNGPQFISDIFVHMSDRLGIRHVKTVVYRPEANGTERVNRNLMQMIANYVNDQHDTWNQFLRELSYAIRTVLNETMGKTSAELFLG
ncbi:uncharacterized protein TNCV_874971 [Trichonephila clavipes]|nr:uncharacterized protein TNCV_874971 [Trichonephila clavipes]